MKLLKAPIENCLCLKNSVTLIQKNRRIFYTSPNRTRHAQSSFASIPECLLKTVILDVTYDVIKIKQKSVTFHHNCLMTHLIDIFIILYLITGKLTLHKKSNFLLRIFLVNVSKLTVFCGFAHIYRRNLLPKTSLSAQCKEFKWLH